MFKYSHGFFSSFHGGTTFEAGMICADLECWDDSFGKCTCKSGATKIVEKNINLPNPSYRISPTNEPQNPFKQMVLLSSQKTPFPLRCFDARLVLPLKPSLAALKRLKVLSGVFRVQCVQV